MKNVLSLFRRPARNIPRQLGKWVVEHRLGCGATGDVYLAHHSTLGRFAALKVLATDFVRSPEYLRRFQTEAFAAARLQHPNLAHIYDVLSEGDWHGIVMEYIDGASLQDLLERKGRIAPRLAASITRDVARGLRHAHENGIIHRDIKPANILLSSHEPETEIDLRVVLTDFGVCQDGDTDARYPGLSRIVGTPYYVSPEQARGERADERSDLYSLGITLFVMLTGRRPFDGRSARTILHKQIHEPPPPVCRWNPEVPLLLGRILHRLLQKDPLQRYESAEALMIDLEKLLENHSPLRCAVPATGLPRRPLTPPPAPAPRLHARGSFLRRFFEGRPAATPLRKKRVSTPRLRVRK